MTRDNRFAVLMFTLTVAGSMIWTVRAKNEPAFSALASTGRHLTASCQGTEETCGGLVGKCASNFNCTFDAEKRTCGNGELCGEFSMTSVCGGTLADNCDGNLNQCVGDYNCTYNNKTDTCGTSGEQCTLGPDEVRITNGTTPNGTNGTTPSPTSNSAFAESRLGPPALLLLSALQLVGWKLLQ
eukprot:CAMPEP_0198211660 /NCGR_PEP_ID=MMETSP1445-20131203/25036_1 /TAXON_ID=36898 /ORGANISM="Pyramimonas sp., Strain CCMP2087" /LENGTH=183 /DNA_ID=CAMNT_0043885973 /DNA_START=123 /DNA_END=674 /DNA_ORIENTATION=+